ncbi:hypothetical protein TNIN_246711 [Trichonephila inaurata madagascariensis]|uniref:Uncharacterized protein n=1 Tax=Trichonephila inaurata madagascariensis TaxID=2747483 RepID=A0A8X6JUF1_9ARAC|nr:hypothetical protein TNIN_246711 [Trichonephila inaurata madagascariensis]
MASHLKFILYLFLFVSISIRDTDGFNKNPPPRHISEFSDPNSGFNPFIDLEEGIVNDARPSFILINSKNDVDEDRRDSWQIMLWNSLMEKTSSFSKNDQENLLKEEVLVTFYPSDKEKQDFDTFPLKISTEIYQENSETTQNTPLVNKDVSKSYRYDASTTVLNLGRRWKPKKIPNYRMPENESEKEQQSSNDKNNYISCEAEPQSEIFLA